ncbi:PREDICTED: vesicle transport protein SFT2C [Ficedula albicollis]|uniref:vesicle transport protein SFT2C n=1 Tax=Ficedula albicollis TaxID=59894 RepID=UPI0007AD95C0|nr:PREDICTED: vesicle transport protein SFT2C [Ficedula albicollis]
MRGCPWEAKPPQFSQPSEASQNPYTVSLIPPQPSLPPQPPQSPHSPHNPCRTPTPYHNPHRSPCPYSPLRAPTALRTPQNSHTARLTPPQHSQPSRPPRTRPAPHAAPRMRAPLPGGAGGSQEEAGDSGGLRAWLGALNPFPAGSPPGATVWPWTGEEDPWLLGLSRWQRLAGSGLCVLLAALCFGLAGLCVPLLLLRARKFALLWSLGSLCALGAAALLRGGAALLAALPGGAAGLRRLSGLLRAAVCGRGKALPL